VTATGDKPDKKADKNPVRTERAGGNTPSAGKKRTQSFGDDDDDEMDSDTERRGIEALGYMSGPLTEGLGRLYVDVSLGEENFS
jgi:hypothetical protein